MVGSPTLASSVNGQDFNEAPDGNTFADQGQGQETGGNVQEQGNDFGQITSNGEICDNTFDDDGDNLIDSDDPDCNLPAETGTGGGAGEATTATEQQQVSSTETPPE